MVNLIKEIFPYIKLMGIGDWGFVIGDWGVGSVDWWK